MLKNVMPGRTLETTTETMTTATSQLKCHKNVKCPGIKVVANNSWSCLGYESRTLCSLLRSEEFLVSRHTNNPEIKQPGRAHFGAPVGQ